MWLLVVFLVSGFCAAILFFLKWRQIKTGRQAYISRLISRGDPFISEIGKNLGEILHHRRERTFFFFLVHMPHRAEIFFVRLRAKLHDYYHGTSARMRGKKNLSSGGASPYMRSMSFRVPPAGGGDSRGF